MIEIIAIDTPSLGDRGYLATDGTVALVVDAQRDVDRVLAVADDRNVTITHVFETHIHNDYVTGGFALATAVGAQYVVNAADPVSFRRTPIADGDEVKIGDMTVRALATPGHTFTHLSYALAGRDEVIAAFTGGSLLSGTTGRTDLLGSEHKRVLARAQFGSVRRLAGELPAGAAICPTHGFGSFCSATPATGSPSTIGAEKRANPALTKPEAEYVDELLAGLDVYPAYYAHMGEANLAGPAAPDLILPRRAAPAELRRRINAGEWVVDLRSRTAFAAGHLRGALNFECGANLATYLGWLIPWGTPLTLIGDSAGSVADAQRELCRIGIDRIEAAADGAREVWAAGEALAAFPTADFATLAARMAGADGAGGAGGARGAGGADRAGGSLVLLDVRRRSEWQAGYISGAMHIPLHELSSRMGEIPGGEIWVHCKAGYRAAVAASLLAAAGRQVVAINDDFSSALGAGLRLAAG
jgi:hydroxyacylglutathione hydrolase